MIRFNPAFAMRVAIVALTSAMIAAGALYLTSARQAVHAELELNQFKNRSAELEVEARRERASPQAVARNGGIILAFEPAFYSLTRRDELEALQGKLRFLDWRRAWAGSCLLWGAAGLTVLGSVYAFGTRRQAINI